MLLTIYVFMPKVMSSNDLFCPTKSYTGSFLLSRNVFETLENMLSMKVNS